MAHADRRNLSAIPEMAANDAFMFTYGWVQTVTLHGETHNDLLCVPTGTIITHIWCGDGIDVVLRELAVSPALPHPRLPIVRLLNPIARAVAARLRGFLAKSRLAPIAYPR